MPDFLVAAGIAQLCANTDRNLERQPAGFGAKFARDMERFPIAIHADAANTQHYELPPQFFRNCLGPRRKYSCCLYPDGEETLAEAEDLALAETCRHAALEDGQSVLELGCGWGSLTFWMAEQYPRSHVTAVSNSALQREYIEERCHRERFNNIRVITADMNEFDIRNQFDRIASRWRCSSTWRTGAPCSTMRGIG